MAGSAEPFRPDASGASVTPAATTRPASTALPIGAPLAPGMAAQGGETLLAMNVGTVPVFVAVDGAASASSGYPLPPNSRTLLHIGPLARSISGVTASGTASLVLTRGTGAFA